MDLLIGKVMTGVTMKTIMKVVAGMEEVAVVITLENTIVHHVTASILFFILTL